MKLSDRIKSAETELVDLKDQLVDTTTQLEATPDDDGLLAQCDELSEKVEQKTKSLESLKRAEAALAEKAMKSSPAIIKSFDNRDAKAGEVLAKMASINLIAHQERKSIDQVLAERYRDDQKANAIIKSAVGGADTTTVGWAAELVRNDVVGFVDMLKPVSVYAQLAALGVPIDFGNANSVSVPRRNSRGGLAGAFVGEQGVIPVGRTTFGASKMNRDKMAIISCFSKELARQATPQIEALIRESMIDDTASTLDYALLDASNAVNGVRPASIRFGAASAAGASGGGSAAVIADIKGMVSTLVKNNAGSKPVLIMNSTTKLSLGLITNAVGDFMFADSLEQNKILSIPILSSTNVPENLAVLVDARYFATAFGVPEFEVSDEATIVMANADGFAPTHAMTSGGEVGTPNQVLPNNGISVAGGIGKTGSEGYQAQSMFQTWQTALRMVMPISWGMAMPNSSVVAERTNITW
jgi:HK97 family phage major capsid protein